MGQTRKIPVIKNRVTLRKSKKQSIWRQVLAVIAAFLVMLLLVWLKVHSNLKLAEIQVLEKTLKENTDENKKLQAEKVRLSSFGRIHKIATKMGLEFPAKENIVELSQK